ADGRQDVNYSNIETFNFTNSSAINGLAAPNFAARAAALAGLNADQRFVQVLYLDVLQRAGSMAELNNWVTGMHQPGSSAMLVAKGIEESLEGRTRMVGSWYQAYLGRGIAGSEAQGWINGLKSGVSEESVIAGILGSAEFFNRAQTLIASGTPNERFVKALYQVLLNRTASTGEVSTYVAQITGGASRTGVAQTIVSSMEYRGYLIQSCYSVLLHRQPDPTGFNVFLNNPSTFTQIRESIESSAEFFTNG